MTCDVVIVKIKWFHEFMERQDTQVSEKCIFRATIGVDHHPSQKNRKKIFYNQRTGKRFPGTDTRVKTAKNLLLLQLQARARAYGIVEPIKHRVRCLLLFGFPPDKFYTKRLTENKNIGDCTNLAQAVEDCLQEACIIENDFYLSPIIIDRVCSDTTQVHIELWTHENNK